MKCPTCGTITPTRRGFQTSAGLAFGGPGVLSCPDAFHDLPMPEFELLLSVVHAMRIEGYRRSRLLLDAYLAAHPEPASTSNQGAAP